MGASTAQTWCWWPPWVQFVSCAHVCACGIGAAASSGLPTGVEGVVVQKSKQSATPRGAARRWVWNVSCSLVCSGFAFSAVSCVPVGFAEPMVGPWLCSDLHGQSLMQRWGRSDPWSSLSGPSSGSARRIQNVTRGCLGRRTLASHSCGVMSGLLVPAWPLRFSSLFFCLPSAQVKPTASRSPATQLLHISEPGCSSCRCCSYSPYRLFPAFRTQLSCHLSQEASPQSPETSSRVLSTLSVFC